MKSALGLIAVALAASAAQAEIPGGFAARVEPHVNACKLIKTPAQLQAIGKNTTTLAGSYCLANDIDLAGVTWTPIGTYLAPPFNGKFYGNGHVIRNLKITASADGAFGLFGFISGGTVRDVGVVDANISVNPPSGGYLGGLFGIAAGLNGLVFISNVYSTGTLACTGTTCLTGGLGGITSSGIVVEDAWSSANVSSDFYAAGLVGAMLDGPGTFQRLYATGNVTGSTSSSYVGGLAGVFAASSSAPMLMVQAYATGKVKGGTNTYVGGLIGNLGISSDDPFVQDLYATGAVSGGASATVGGLIGAQQSGTIDQAFASGAVTGGMTRGGLLGSQPGGGASNTYWDTNTSGQATSAAGTGRTTAQLRGALPSGFTLGWGITKTLSYPYLGDPDNFSSTLATLVLSNKIFTILPLQQSDKGQYIGKPSHTDETSLATVYTMIARAVGIADNVSTLSNVKIDKYFWHDATQKTTFAGPLKTGNHAVLGAMTTIAAGTHLNSTNVIGQMNAQHLVILRGTYTKPGGGTATHYMLGTLYRRSGQLVTVVANDPWTGRQIEISPATKKVVTPSFPLTDFIVNGYQAVTTLN